MAKVGAINNLKNTIKINNPFKSNASEKISNNKKSMGSNISSIIATTIANSSKPRKTAPKIDLFA